MPKTEKNDIELLKTWALPSDATLGSAVRAKGILQELRARLPIASRKALDIDQGELSLTMPAAEKTEFQTASAIVGKALQDIQDLPVIPREIEDILAIKTSERHRWLADGRLPSAGTRTVKLRGRARKITFHVFDPKVVAELLDRGAADEWREDDLAARAEKRRQAAYKAKLTRSLKKKAAARTTREGDDAARILRGWEAFDVDGLLR